jgi:hypothetical protein
MVGVIVAVTLGVGVMVGVIVGLGVTVEVTVGVGVTWSSSKMTITFPPPPAPAEFVP